jgi:hypothetical protein
MSENMLGYANHLGLSAEEISMTGDASGNFQKASRIWPSSARPSISISHSTSDNEDRELSQIWVPTCKVIHGSRLFRDLDWTDYR